MQSTRRSPPVSNLHSSLSDGTEKKGPCSNSRSWLCKSGQGPRHSLGRKIWREDCRASLLNSQTATTNYLPRIASKSQSLYSTTAHTFHLPRRQKTPPYSPHRVRRKR